MRAYWSVLLVFRVAQILMYSFVVLLVLIGLTNVISTMTTNVMMRSREFAVLQSIGMTPEGLRRMLNLENILCSAKALLFGIPIAILLTYLINLPIKALLPIPYETPWLAMLLCVGAENRNMGIAQSFIYKVHVIERMKERD